MRQPFRLGVVVSGLALGFVLSRLGFTDFTSVHAMFTFSDLRLIGVFATAVVVTGIGLRLVPAGRVLPKRDWHSGLIPGGVLFGVGWAISGTCPGATLAMVGEGRGAAVIGLLGVFVGTALKDALDRFAHPTSSTPT